MQHPVMGAAKAVVRQDAIRIADEVPIGEEEKLNENEMLLGERLSSTRGGGLRKGARQ